MKAHLALRCFMVNYQVKVEYLCMIKSEDISEQLIQDQSNNDNISADPWNWPKLRKSFDRITNY